MTSEITKLVEAAQSGDQAAFDEIVRLTYAETYTLAMRLTSNSEDAADVVQEAYLRAYRSIDKFRGDAQFSTWLYRITANCASTHLTKRNRHRHDELDVDAQIDTAPTPDARSDASLDRQRLSQALAALPQNLREVIVLRDIYDLPHEAIARELGISEVTAKVRLHRARKKLRDRLMPHGEEYRDVEAI